MIATTRTSLRLCVSACSLAMFSLAGAVQAFSPGDTVPGHLLSPPHGSRGEIKTEGSYAAGVWTVILTRSQTTASPTGDVQLDLSNPANLYDFSVAIFDNAGGNPTSMAPQDSSGYTLGNESSAADLAAQPVASVPTSAVDFTGAALVSSPIGAVAPVSLKAAYDAKNVYILAVWEDFTGTESLSKDQWTFDGTSWSQSGNEDRIAIMFNINASDWTAGCGVYCHVGEAGGSGGRHRTHFSGETLDMWHWKAHRSNPMGFADDKHVIFDTPTGGLGTRKGDDGSSVDSSNKNGIGPKFVAENDPGANATFLYNLPAGSKRAVPFSPTAGWLAGDTVPGHVLSAAWDSRAEIAADGSYGSGVWTVILYRAQATNTPFQDVQLDLSNPANLYDFSVAIFDNAGGNPTSMAPQDSSGYTLGNESSAADLAAQPVASVPTSAVDFTGAALVSSPIGAVAPVSLKAAYDAKNVYILAVWEDFTGTESLSKDQWTFDGTSWSQSGNEDRIAIMFNINASDWTAGCGVYCHVGEAGGSGGRHRTHFSGETLDMWHWKAARSNPMEAADDKHVIFDTPTGGLSTRKGDDGDSVDSKNDDGGGLPALQAENDPGVNATFLINMPAGAVRAVVPEPGGPWPAASALASLCGLVLWARRRRAA